MKYLIAALALAFAASASPALALSCMDGNTAAGWKDAIGTNLPFRVVQGTFEMDVPGLQFEEEEFTLPAQFTGQVIASDGTTTPLSTSVKVIGACANGDCGYVYPDTEILTFLFDAPDEAEPITYSWPCAAYPMAATAETVTEVLRCLNGGRCVEAYN